MAELQMESPGEQYSLYDVNFPAKDAVTTRLSEVVYKVPAVKQDFPDVNFVG
jgi:hypothetical protein